MVFELVQVRNHFFQRRILTEYAGSKEDAEQKRAGGDGRVILYFVKTLAKNIDNSFVGSSPKHNRPRNHHWLRGLIGESPQLFFLHSISGCGQAGQHVILPLRKPSFYFPIHYYLDFLMRVHDRKPG